MNATRDTLIFAGAAIVLAVVAFIVKPSTQTAAAFNDEGQQFFPRFESPTAATAIEVTTWDEAERKPVSLRVEYSKKQGWTIPSHHGYPADAKERLARIATRFIGLKKETYLGESKVTHKDFDLLDPREKDTTAVSGLGKRVTLLDENGTVLCDYIIGKQAAGSETRKYVRVPGSDRVYQTEVEADIPVKFEDWIDTDLLKLKGHSVKSVKFNNYSLSFSATGIFGYELDIKDRETLNVRKGEDYRWAFAELNDKNESFDDTAINELTNALGEVKILGVRKNSPDLVEFLASPDYRQTPDSANIVIKQCTSIGEGFYYSRDARLVLGKEGECVLRNDRGLVYTLRFGDIARGSGMELSAGTTGSQGSGTGPENRYLMVSVDFDPSLLPEPQKPARPEKKADDKPADKPAEGTGDGENKPAEQPAKDPAAQAAEDAAADAEYEKKIKDWEAKVNEWRRKMDDGKKEAADLKKKFAQWFYVIPESAYKKLRLSRKNLVKARMDNFEVGVETTLPSGLKITELVVGTGREAKKGDTAKVHYKGMLMDGTVFDASPSPEQAFMFKVGVSGAIQGWLEGIQGMKVGGKRKLVIPPEMAYGAAGSPPKIPPNSTLIFECELVHVFNDADDE